MDDADMAFWQVEVGSMFRRLPGLVKPVPRCKSLTRVNPGTARFIHLIHHTAVFSVLQIRNCYWRKS
jgi:hypothetical protein